MSDFQEWPEGDTEPWLAVNENFEAIAGASLYAWNKDTTSGLVYGYMGGVFKDTPVSTGTTTLADNTTNYVVAHLTTGAITDATTTTNWDDDTTYARVAKVTTASGDVTAVVDYRFDEFGLFPMLASGGVGGTGDVDGPGSAVDDRIATFDGTTGKLIQDGGKTIAELRAPAIQSVSSSATVTPTFADDLVTITAQAAALALANPTGTAIPGLGIVIRIKDNGTARAISYDTQYRAIGVTLPTTTVISKTLYLAMIYNSTDTKWDVLAVGQEA